MRTVSEATADW